MTTKTDPKGNIWNCWPCWPRLCQCGNPRTFEFIERQRAMKEKS